MATSSLIFPDGGVLTAEFDGDENGSITLTAPANEGKDRTLTMNVSTSGGEVTESVSVTQEGRREEFVAGDNFYASDGEFLVIKNGL